MIRLATAPNRMIDQPARRAAGPGRQPLRVTGYYWKSSGD